MCKYLFNLYYTGVTIVKFLLGSFFILLIHGCDTKIDSIPKNQVEEYIFELQANQYQEFKFPSFSASHISQLLEFGNETIPTRTFPHNPVVCYMTEAETKVGVVVLWTIESIRRSFLEDSEELIYPSADPLLIMNDPQNEDYNYYHGYHIKAYEAYKKWWQLELPLGEKMKINPLGDSTLKWR